MSEDKKKSEWKGLIPTFRNFLFGKARPPKLRRYGPSSTRTTSEQYTSMPGDYRWFRQDELVRKCVVINALFATMTAGFRTELEATSEEVDVETYKYVKEGIDDINKRVNLDQTLFIAQVKRSIYGKAGFEIVLNDDKTPSWLLGLQSDKLKPKPNENWELITLQYEGREDFYKPDEVLYFTNLQLESDYDGLSDVEPIRDVCQARHNLLREDFPEIVRTLWAPYIIAEVNTSGLASDKVDTYLDAIAESLRAGKSVAVSEGIKTTVVKITPDITGLVKMLDKLEQAIIGNFGTPRFLLGKPIENRATAYAELEAYVQGPIAHIQRYLRRAVESQWYDRWALQLLEKGGVKVPEGEQPPVLVKHKWNQIRVTDVYEMAKAVAVLYGNGLGLLADHLDKGWEMMSWDPAELEEHEQT